MRGQLAAISPQAKPTVPVPHLWLLGWAQKNFAGEGLRGLRHEHSYGVSDIAGLQHSLRFLSFVRAEIRIDRAGADDRDADVVNAQFLGYRIAQAIETPFGGRVGGAAGKGILAGEGRNINDVSALGADHERSEAANHVVDAAQIGVHGAIPGLGREFVERQLRFHDAGVVDEDIEAVKGALDAVGEGCDRGEIGDIALDDGALMAVVLNGGGGGFESGAGTAAEDGAGSEFGQLAGDGCADAAACAGDDCDLPRDRLVALSVMTDSMENQVGLWQCPFCVIRSASLILHHPGSPQGSL